MVQYFKTAKDVVAVHRADATYTAHEGVLRVDNDADAREFAALGFETHFGEVPDALTDAVHDEKPKKATRSGA